MHLKLKIDELEQEHLNNRVDISGTLNISNEKCLLIDNDIRKTTNEGLSTNIFLTLITQMLTSV